MSESSGDKKWLKHVTSGEPMPRFLVEKGFRADAAPTIRIEGRKGGDSYNFIFDASHWGDLLREQIRDLFPRRGATGNVRYVRDEARLFLEEILSGKFEQRQKRRPA